MCVVDVDCYDDVRVTRRTEPVLHNERPVLKRFGTNTHKVTALVFTVAIIDQQLLLT